MSIISAPYRSNKRLICLKEKDSDRKSGYQLPQPATLTTSADNSCPIDSTYPYSFKKFLSRTYSRFINMFCPHKHTHNVFHSHKYTHSLSHTYTYAHRDMHKKSVHMFGWEIFRAVWKGTGGGQELSVEVIKAAGWGNWYLPLFDQSLFVLNIVTFSLRWEHFSAGTVLFTTITKILNVEVG